MIGQRLDAGDVDGLRDAVDGLGCEPRAGEGGEKEGCSEKTGLAAAGAGICAEEGTEKRDKPPYMQSHGSSFGE